MRTLQNNLMSKEGIVKLNYKTLFQGRSIMQQTLAALFVSILGLTFASGDAFAEAEKAGETVRKTVEEVRAAVVERQDELSPTEMDEALKKIIYPIFDFEEMSRRSLGANWKTANAEQRKEFVELFSDLLARNYLKKIRENVADSEFTLVGQTANNSRALVRTLVAYEGDKVKLDYRLREKEGNWRVYDVVIENVGLVSNYRSEFAGIVRREGMDGLLKRLREKL